jgi:hypothetical protein
MFCLKGGNHQQTLLPSFPTAGCSVTAAREWEEERSRAFLPLEPPDTPPPPNAPPSERWEEREIGFGREVT